MWEQRGKKEIENFILQSEIFKKLRKYNFFTILEKFEGKICSTVTGQENFSKAKYT